MKKCLGFTLIEVLIALVILSISLTAIVKATSSNISNTTYIKNKALAHLVALEAQQLIQLNSLNFNGNKTEQKTILADKEWFWQAIKKQTLDKNIYAYTVDVSLDHQNILSETNYLLELKNNT